jgi:uncharacterized protein (TIGR00730 family)
MSSETYPIRSIAVYCASSPGHNPIYRQAARALGRIMAERSLELVYGGGSVGLMGEIADAVMENGGKVTGVIPDFLYQREVGHNGLTELFIVDSMHTRKRMMFERCDAIITLPGGFGTLEELFEMLTWAQLNLHRKPIGLLNVEGFYDHLIALVNHMHTEGLLSSSSLQLLLHASHPEALLQKLTENLLYKGDNTLSTQQM